MERRARRRLHKTERMFAVSVAQRCARVKRTNAQTPYPPMRAGRLACEEVVIRARPLVILAGLRDARRARAAERLWADQF